MSDPQTPFERRRANQTIRIERHNRSWIPWLLGIAALLIVLSVLLPDSGDNAPAAYDTTGTAVADGDLREGELVASVNNFTQFVDSQRTGVAVARSHDFTAEGIRRLAAAMRALAARDSVAAGALAPRIDALRERATALQQDPTASTHALQAREAFLIAASALDYIQDQRFADLDRDAQAVLDAATGVEARASLTDQAPAVQTFFDRASHLLHEMTREGELATGSGA